MGQSGSRIRVPLCRNKWLATGRTVYIDARAGFLIRVKFGGTGLDSEENYQWITPKDLTIALDEIDKGYCPVCDNSDACPLEPQNKN